MQKTNFIQRLWQGCIHINYYIKFNKRILREKCTNEHLTGGKKRVQCMILSFIPMSKVAAALCAWLLPVTSWEWVGWQRLLSTWSWQALACLVGQGQVLTEVFFQQPFCSGSEHQPARREFSLWSCDAVRVWWGDRCAWISCRTRGTQIFSHRCAFAGDGKVHLSGQISYRSRPSCSWRVSHLREGSTERNRNMKSQHESYRSHETFPPHTFSDM